MRKVLITDKAHSLLQSGLEDRGYEVIYDTSVTLETLPNILPNLHGIVINSKIIMDKKMIDLGSNLVFIARLGSGMEIIDRDYAKSKGIVVVNSPEGNRDSVAEHAIGMLLSLANNIKKSDSEVRNFSWDRESNRGFELMGKTMGIIGFGNTGSRMALKLSAWELNIIYHDKFPENLGGYATSFHLGSKEEILLNADIISLHLPLTDDTYHYVDQEFLSQCKDGVIIINTSRGKVIDTMALIKGLESGKVGGACLDVFENEKTDTYLEDEYSMYQKLFTFKNTILSPHVAGWTNESLIKIASYILEKLDKA